MQQGVIEAARIWIRLSAEERMKLVTPEYAQRLTRGLRAPVIAANALRGWSVHLQTAGKTPDDSIRAVAEMTPAAERIAHYDGVAGLF
jgi:hypothetical protein